MAKLVQITLAATCANDVFFRLGRAWPKAGTVVSSSDFDPAEWDILIKEPMLHIGPAPENAVAASEAATLREAIKAALGKLAPEDFDDKGQPKADAVRKALPPKTKGVTADVVAEVWAELTAAA